MLGRFAAKRLHLSATKVEHESLSQKIWPVFKNYILIPVLVMILLYVWQYIRIHEIFPVKNITVVDKAAHIDPNKVRSIVLPNVTEGFLRVNIAQLQKQLLALPWVKEVAITRIWPNQLAINFTEYQPIAAWDKTALITADGIIFTPDNNTDIPKGLPLLIGPNAEEKNILAHYKLMQQMLSPLHLKIKELDVSNRLAWVLLLNNDMHVDLGEQNPIARLKTFVTIYPQVFATTKKADYVDMRYEHGMAIHWNNVTDNVNKLDKA